MKETVKLASMILFLFIVVIVTIGVFGTRHKEDCLWIVPHFLYAGKC